MLLMATPYADTAHAFDTDIGERIEKGVRQ
jgi:hypothetical protein